VVLSDDRRCHRGRAAVAHVVLPGLRAICLGRLAHSRPPSGRRHLGAYPFVVVSAMLDPRAVRESRNVDGGPAVSGTAFAPSMRLSQGPASRELHESRRGLRKDRVLRCLFEVSLVPVARARPAATPPAPPRAAMKVRRLMASLPKEHYFGWPRPLRGRLLRRLYRL
jgi:hypothetical protein